MNKSILIYSAIISVVVVYFIFSVHGLNKKNSRLEKQLAIATSALESAKKSFDEIGELSLKNDVNQKAATEKINILNKIIQENSGMMYLAGSMITDLEKTIEMQKAIISRGTSPTDKEASALREMEINVLASAKTVSIYSDRMKRLQEEMLAK